MRNLSDVGTIGPVLRYLISSAPLRNKAAINIPISTCPSSPTVVQAGPGGGRKRRPWALLPERPKAQEPSARAVKQLRVPRAVPIRGWVS